jgi:hypothetical protein
MSRSVTIQVRKKVLLDQQLRMGARVVLPATGVPNSLRATHAFALQLTN